MNRPGSEPGNDRRPELRRVLGSWDAAALIIGIMIGSGIFATPPIVAGYLPGSGAMLGIWVLGGVLALCGAFCYAELAAMFPRTGGSFVFLYEGYGPLPAFAYGWSALLVTYPASIAAVSKVFTAYLARLIPIADSLQGPIAAFVCLLLVVLNILGVRLGAWALKLFTGSKVLALSAVVLVALVGRRGSWDNLSPVWPASMDGMGGAAIALALVAIIWTYEGWTDGPTLAGEVRNRDRDVVRALLLGTLGVTLVYLLANLAYVYVLGLDGVTATDSVATDVATRVFGRGGDLFVTLLVLVSTLGSIMGMIIGGSRVFFAMGRNRLFFDWAGRVNRRWHTPAAALASVGIIAAVYTLLGTFEEIIRYFVFVSTIWVMFIIASVIKHRILRPGARRPFRVPVYPIPPLIYLGVAAGLLYQLFRQNSRDALVGLAVVLASIPGYLVWRRLRLGDERTVDD